MAPWARLQRRGRQTTSDSSYSSTAPKPLQSGQAPRGLLKEKRAGVTTAAGVSQALQAGDSVKRSRPAVVQREGDPLALLERGRDGLAQASERAPRRRCSRSTTTSSSARPGEVEARRAARPGGGPRRRRRPGRSPARAGSPPPRHGPAARSAGAERRSAPGPGAPAHDLVGRRLGRVPPDRAAARPAPAPADPGPEQSEVVVDLGGGADGGPAGDRRVPLLDGHRRARCPRGGPPAGFGIRSRNCLA